MKWIILITNVPFVDSWSCKSSAEKVLGGKSRAKEIDTEEDFDMPELAITD